MDISPPRIALNDTTAIPAVGFGTYLVSDDDAPEVIATAIASGYRHIDTAAGYHNEAGVGAGIRQAMAAQGLSRGDLFVTTKLWPGNPAWGDTPKGGPETIAACEESLAKLGLSFVDLYLIHAPFGGDKRLDLAHRARTRQRHNRRHAHGWRHLHRDGAQIWGE